MAVELGIPYIVYANYYCNMRTGENPLREFMEFEMIKNNIINITTSQFLLFIKHQVPISSIPDIFKIKHYCIP